MIEFTVYRASELLGEAGAKAESFCYQSVSGKAFFELASYDLEDCGIIVSRGEDGFLVVSLDDTAINVANALSNEEMLPNDFTAHRDFINGRITEKEFMCAITNFALEFVDADREFEFTDDGKVFDNGSIFLSKYYLKEIGYA